MRGWLKWRLLWIGAALLVLLLLPLATVTEMRVAFIKLVAPLSSFAQSEEAKEALQCRLEKLQLQNVALRAALQGYLDRSEEAFVPYTSARPLYWDIKGEGDFLWIRADREGVQKNSPVVVGHFAAGVIDKVEGVICRMRLLTDLSLHPAVEVVRGPIAHARLLDYVDALLNSTALWVLASEKKEALVQQLNELKAAQQIQGQSLYFAKSILQGSADRSKKQQGLVSGIGFTNDYKERAMIREGDFLVTAGLDGVFPPYLFIGQVVRVELAQSSDPTFEFVVKLGSHKWHAMTHFSILPAIENAL